jgi:hypothetical protein
MLLVLFGRDNRVVAPVTCCWGLAVRFKPARAARGLPPVSGTKRTCQAAAAWALGRRSAGVPTSECIGPAAGKAFDTNGQLLDAALPRRADKMIDELLWMARVLRYGREYIPAE